jgi:hypothetical protein
MPTLTGFLAFISGVMGINPLYLPTDAPVIGYAFQVALALVNQSLCCVPGNIYALAVYNLAGSQVINFAPDQPGRTYFADLRKTLGISTFTAGVVSSTSDQGTSTALLNPEFMKGLTMQNLQNMKDPYGRQYIAFAQDYGPTVWGLS